MLSLYPTAKKLTFLLAAMLILGSAQAQQGDYVSNSSNDKYSAGKTPVRAGMVIRINGRNERQVMLNWSPFAGGVSHYVLERSGDGRHYEEAGVLFTGDSDDEPQYYYTDKLRKPYAGPLYYRLRVVGLDGTELYTLPSISGSLQQLPK